MKHIRLTIEQYKIAIKKLPMQDQHRLIDLYYCYPSATIKDVAIKMKIGSVSELNLLTGKLDKALAHQANYTNLFERFRGMMGHRGFFSLIHEEVNGKPSTYWRIKPDLNKALEELKLVTPKKSRVE